MQKTGKPLLPVVRMQMLRGIFSLFLAAALLAGGMPASIFEDADRDSDVDLKDAVLLVSQIEKSAGNHQNFPQTFRQAVSALRVAAGLKTIIRSSEDNASDPGKASSSGLYLVSSKASILPAGSFSITIHAPAAYQSCFIPPPSPPPEIC